MKMKIVEIRLVVSDDSDPVAILDALGTRPGIHGGVMLGTSEFGAFTFPRPDTRKFFIEAADSQIGNVNWALQFGEVPM
jgi:hypothetical protein